MEKSKRTQNEIEKDCKKIKEAAKTASSMKELMEVTGLTYPMLKTTLKKHPIIEKRVLKQLEENQKKKEQEDEEELMQANEIPKETKLITQFVVDASISGNIKLKEIVERICKTNAKIILTSITIRELERLEDSKQKSGIGARYILNEAIEKEKSFEMILINENSSNPDDCIIQYCADNKENTMLLTSDKAMTLKAKMHGIDVEYLKHLESSAQSNQSFRNTRMKTLYPANMIDHKLMIDLVYSPKITIYVHSNGIEYTRGRKQLEIGDDVYIGTNKTEYMTFAHYRMTSLEEANNCELIFSKRIYEKEDVNILNGFYKTFLKDFMQQQ